MRLHNPRRCPTCRSFSWAVRAGLVTCVHAFGQDGDEERCELCLNVRERFEPEP